MTRTLEAIARLTGEIGQLAHTLNITNNVLLVEHPEFLKLQATLLRALAPYPDARAEVVQALRSLDAERAPAVATTAPARMIEHVEH